MELLDSTLNWKWRPFPQYLLDCPYRPLSLCANLEINSDYMITEVNDLGVTSAGDLDLLFLEEKEVSINFSLIY